MLSRTASELFWMARYLERAESYARVLDVTWKLSMIPRHSQQSRDLAPAEYVRDGNELLAATITPQHLMFNRNHMLVGGIRPHLYCLPVLKRNIHQQALRELVASGFSRAFLGTDSAPHARHRKEASCGCAGCFNAPTALGSYATVFEEMNALQHFEAFCSLNGPRFYGLPVNESYVELVREETTVVDSIALPNDTLVPFLAGETVRWTVKK